MDFSEKGRAIVEAFRAGEHARVSDACAPAVKAQLTPEAVEQMWTQLANQVGPLHEIGDAGYAQTAGYHLVPVKVKFEKMDIVVRVVFDDEGLVAGLNFLPG